MILRVRISPFRPFLRKYFVCSSLANLCIDMEVTSELVATCHSFAELSRKLRRSPHNRLTHQLREKLIEQNIPFDHFTKNGVVACPLTSKKCPICGNSFEVKSGQNDGQTTCSYSCSNVFFARKRYKPENYKNHRTICFAYHDKICVVCGEDKIVAVHHMDGNDKNNDPVNLVPLCPTHHQYWHSRYRSIVKGKIDDYRSKKVLTFRSKHV